MTERSLSENITHIEVEIQFYKEQAGQSLWEIGRRLNFVKENNLNHGEFGEWLNTIDISHSVANRLMKIARELPNSVTLQNLGMTALYLIASLPPEERETPHMVITGELKKPEEMTVVELRQLNRQYTNEIATQKNENTRLHREITDLKNQPPRIVVKEVPQPDTQLMRQQKDLENELEATKERLKTIDTQYQNVLLRETESKQKAAELDRIKADITVLTTKRDTYAKELNGIANYVEFKNHINDLLLKISPIRYQDDFNVINQSPILKEQYLSIIDRVQEWCNDMTKQISPRNSVEGDFTEINDAQYNQIGG